MLRKVVKIKQFLTRTVFSLLPRDYVLSILVLLRPPVLRTQGKILFYLFGKAVDEYISILLLRDSSTSMDNSSEVVTKIAGIYAERLMSDVILVVGKQELAAHRLILCASSEVFQIMLMSTNWTESSERKIVLKVSLTYCLPLHLILSICFRRVQSVRRFSKSFSSICTLAR